jgi:hypothetical protein
MKVCRVELMLEVWTEDPLFMIGMSGGLLQMYSPFRFSERQQCVDCRTSIAI